jgi:hypothetical protein
MQAGIACCIRLQARSKCRGHHSGEYARCPVQTLNKTATGSADKHTGETPVAFYKATARNLGAELPSANVGYFNAPRHMAPWLPTQLLRSNPCLTPCTTSPWTVCIAKAPQPTQHDSVTHLLHKDAQLACCCHSSRTTGYACAAGARHGSSGSSSSGGPPVLLPDLCHVGDIRVIQEIHMGLGLRSG